MIVIYGAGEVGVKAFSNFYQEQSCVIIDIQPLPDHFPYRELIHIITDIHQIQFNNPNTENLTHYFIQGGIEHLYQLFYIKIPEILLPAAPIHVMAELLLFTARKLNVSITIESVMITNSRFQEQNPPKNLNLLTVPPNKIYFSYAHWDEICPEDCMGTPNYCPNFERTKDETVSEFIIRACSAQKIGKTMVQIFHFPSTQILGGLGGIFKDVLLNGWNHWFDLILSPPTERHIIIATTCNCHGVAEEILLKR